MQVFELADDTAAEIGRARLRRHGLPVFGMDPATCEAVVVGVCKPLMDAAGLRLTWYQQFRWFARELARVVRTKQGHELGFDVEALMRKWAGYGLDQQLLQTLVRECLAQLSAPVVEVRDETQA